MCGGDFATWEDAAAAAAADAVQVHLMVCARDLIRVELFQIIAVIMYPTTNALGDKQTEHEACL